ncbi:hypothetical protein NBRC111894_79 [Sporolactobacillus inulinus]|uniref:Uncharacterized protein n=1 Tax=Sporolactobacillus inulinus TaxID=2078 RepID=A0A4Y1Z669_9BACL|nr:hypothetical protein NBRC111894_79 [Sporolactobacillus inulinus]
MAKTLVYWFEEGAKLKKDLWQFINCQRSFDDTKAIIFRSLFALDSVQFIKELIVQDFNISALHSE